MKTAEEIIGKNKQQIELDGEDVTIVFYSDCLRFMEAYKSQQSMSEGEILMEARKIFVNQSIFNKWLKELTNSEQAQIIEMIIAGASLNNNGSGMKWVKASELKEINLRRHYIGKISTDFVNSGCFMNGYFVFDSTEYEPILEKDFDKLFILQIVEESQPPSGDKIRNMLDKVLCIIGSPEMGDLYFTEAEWTIIDSAKQALKEE